MSLKIGPVTSLVVGGLGSGLLGGTLVLNVLQVGLAAGRITYGKAT